MGARDSDNGGDGVLSGRRATTGCWRAGDDGAPILPPASRRPRLVVVVDTEEEFDWSRPGDPAARSVAAMDALPRFHELCVAAGLEPAYVATWPVLASDRAASMLERWLRGGEAELGLHLHAWVTPPWEDPAAETFQANLPAGLEFAKLRELRALFEARFGRAPRLHKAGRYGIGRQTVSALAALGLDIDLSLSPPFDYRRLGGPDFSASPAHPSWLLPGRVLSLPTTGGHLGPLGRLAGTSGRVDGVLRRLRLRRKLRLSPEGADFGPLRELTLRLHAAGVRDFTFSLHSPSLEPGRTPYVRDPEDRRRLLDTCRRYFGWFRDAFDGEFATPTRIAADHLVPSPA